MKLADLYPRLPGPLQTLGLNVHAWRIHRERFGRPFRIELERFLDRERRPLDSIRAYQAERLRELIAHAYETVPYYRERMDALSLKPGDIRSVEDLPKLPLLRRDTVRVELPRLLSRSFTARQRIHGHTSGTTGTPLQVYWDQRTCIINNVVDWRQKTWAGMKYGDPYAVLFGRMVVPTAQKKPPFWRMNYLHNQLWLSTFHMSPANLEAYVGKLRSFGPVAIEGYPSTLFILALHLIHKRQTLPLRAALTTSETLYPEQRDTIERAFACRVFDFYGQAERVVFATECERHEGHHPNLDYGVLEVVNDRGEPVREGELGWIVGTSLHNHAMPLLRYVTSDVTRLRLKPCSCGRSFPVMDDVTTKAEDIVVTKDGRFISPSTLTHPFKELENVVMSQILQETPEELIVRIVRAKDYDERQAGRLTEALQQRVGEDMRVTIQYVSEIERTAAGKFKWVISKVPLELD